MTDKTEILAVITEAIKEILPDVDESLINDNASLTELGANSIDRSEIVMQTMMDLGVKTSLGEMAALKNIGELANFYYEHINK